MLLLRALKIGKALFKYSWETHQPKNGTISDGFREAKGGVSMQTAAFLTYNQIGREGNVRDGWHEANGRRAFVLQNTKGEGSYRNGGPIGTARREEEVGELWAKVQEVLPELDHVVVYVGTDGSEQAIALARQLPASKVTFVACDCNLLFKEMLIQAMGLKEAGRVLCECGGHRTMEFLFRNFLSTGTLQPARPEEA